jgi:hypothetical protein
MNTVATNSLQILSSALDEWVRRKRQIESENTSHGTCFNPLSIIPVSEKIHSKILGDLLNPKGGHGQGNLFLLDFLDHLKVPNPEKGEWSVSVEEGRVDVMLWRHDPSSVVIIENKAKGAVDQRNQLYRYWHENIYSWKPHLDYQSEDVRANYKLIYMPADGGKWPEWHSLIRPNYLNECNPRYERLPISCERLLFAEFGELLKSKSLPSVPESNQRLRSFLNFYIEMWTI